MLRAGCIVRLQVAPDGEWLLASRCTGAPEITLTGLGLGPNDSLCCPTKPFERVFALQGDQLLEVAQADAPGPSTTPAPDGTAAAPDMLTDTVRADILAGVDRANSAWVASGQSLDDSALDGAVAGQLLSDDLAEVNRLRGQGQTPTSINTAFAVTDVTLDAPGHAVVRTHETWYAETSERATRRLVQRTPSATYNETYIVEYQDGRWIVTRNDL